MSRGKWLKTKLREAYNINKKKWAAYWQAEEEHYKKHPHAWLREIASNILKNIDPFEAAAIIGGSIIVHDIILKSDDVVRALDQWKDSNNVVIAGLAQSGIAGTGSIGVELAYLIAPDLFKKAGVEKGTAMPRTMEYEIVYWLMSFCISYWAFKHGDDLVGVAKVFIGVK